LGKVGSTTSQAERRLTNANGPPRRGRLPSRRSGQTRTARRSQGPGACRERLQERPGMALLLSPKRRKRSQRKLRLRQRQPLRLKLEPAMPTYRGPFEPGEVLVRVQLEEQAARPAASAGRAHARPPPRRSGCALRSRAGRTREDARTTSRTHVPTSALSQRQRRPRSPVPLVHLVDEWAGSSGTGRRP